MSSPCRRPALEVAIFVWHHGYRLSERFLAAASPLVKCPFTPCFGKFDFRTTFIRTSPMAGQQNVVEKAPRLHTDNLARTLLRKFSLPTAFRVCYRVNGAACRLRYVLRGASGLAIIPSMSSVVKSRLLLRYLIRFSLPQPRMPQTAPLSWLSDGQRVERLRPSAQPRPDPGSHPRRLKAMKPLSRCGSCGACQDSIEAQYINTDL